MISIPYVFRCDSVTPETTPGDGVQAVLSLYRRVGGELAAAPSGCVSVHVDAGALTAGTLYTLTLAPLT